MLQRRNCTNKQKICPSNRQLKQRIKLTNKKPNHFRKCLFYTRPNRIIKRLTVLRSSSPTIIPPPIFMLSFSALMFRLVMGVVVLMLLLDPPSPFTALRIKLQYPALWAGGRVGWRVYRCHSRQIFHQHTIVCKKKSLALTYKL